MSEEKEKQKAGRRGDGAEASSGAPGNSMSFRVDRDAPIPVDLKKILEPISPEAPAGSDLRYEGTYDRIQDARREEDDLPQGVWERELKKADWHRVRDLCIDALERRSKDLQIAVWLIEALIALYGFGGLREGLRLLLELSETFWDDLYPKINDEDPEARLFPYFALNEKIALKIKFIPLTNPRSVDAHPYTYADWESANRLDQMSQKQKEGMERQEAHGKVTRAQFLGSVMFSTREFYTAQANDLNDGMSLLKSLEAFLEEKYGKEAPGFQNLRDIISGIYRLTDKFLSEKRKEEIEPEVSDAGSLGSEGTADEGKGGSRKPAFLSIRNRAEAYRMLSEAADYLLIHEPHSPAPYLVKRAVLWGQMSLTELLQELVGDESDLREIFKLLGLKFSQNQ